jgi:hypothetical protein
MNDSRAMSEGQKLGEMGNGKRTLIILVAVLVVSVLIGVLVIGFRGSHVRRNAAAMATPIGTTVGPRLSPAALPPTAIH